MKRKIVMNSIMAKMFESPSPIGSEVSFTNANLRELFLPTFINKYGCITFAKEEVAKESEEEFSSRIKRMFGDKTGYEAASTETYINYFVEGEKNSVLGLTELAFAVSEVWMQSLQLLKTSINVCFIISCDMEYQSVTIRFHQIRKSEPMWLSSDWKNVENPICCIYLCEDEGLLE